MKKRNLILFLIILTGCGSSLSTSWDNFTAYYNTYYNAKNDFAQGLQKVKAQPVHIDPDILIRAYPAPINAGTENFVDAIDKGGFLLRRHPESKWTDDALLLIGKSYYYQQEFFLAIQTFEDLLNITPSNNLKQQAVLWKGRALLDISSYGDGVSFLQTKLRDTEINWDSSLKAETQVLLAEHLAMMQNWQEAAELMEPAILNIEDHNLKGQNYFLLGQIFQKQGDLNRAYQAYSNVAPNFPDYEYIYWAGIKRAEVSRLNGDTDLAISIYAAMIKDDKNFDRFDQISYQLAQAYEKAGKYEQAEIIYKNILRSPGANNFPNILAGTYYQLGQLYSDQYTNYKLAAAYFDSSSAQSSQNISNNADATNLASTYSQYISLKDNIAAIDSLVQLSRLSRQQLDSVLVQVRLQKRLELQNRQNRVQQTSNTLLNTNQNTFDDSVEQTTNSSSSGFLNYRNIQMVEKAKQQFRAVWGARPLVDDWRRSNAIANAGGENESSELANPDRLENTPQGLTDQQLGIDINDIPFSAQAKNEKRETLLNLQYRLGNLFFLTLNQPDSARYYYRKVLQHAEDSELRPKTLYSLYQLYDLQQQVDSAALYKQRIITDYPESVYAGRIVGTQNENLVIEGKSDSTALLRKQVQQLLADEDPEMTVARQAEKLRELALQNKTSPLASSIFYQAIRKYIEFAKTYPDGIIDSTATDSLASSTANDSTDLAYTGTSWDRVRDLLAEFKQLFTDAPQVNEINAWSAEIANFGSDRIYSCSELAAKPTVQPDMQAFLKNVELPDKLKGLNLAGTLTYKMIIKKDGTIESFELLSKPTNLGIEEAYEQAFSQSLRFVVSTKNGLPVRASCEVTFPIQQ